MKEMKHSKEPKSQNRLEWLADERLCADCEKAVAVRDGCEFEAGDVCDQCAQSQLTDLRAENKRLTLACSKEFESVQTLNDENIVLRENVKSFESAARRILWGWDNPQHPNSGDSIDLGEEELRKILKDEPTSNPIAERAVEWFKLHGDSFAKAHIRHVNHEGKALESLLAILSQLQEKP